MPTVWLLWVQVWQLSLSMEEALQRTRLCPFLWKLPSEKREGGSLQISTDFSASETFLFFHRDIPWLLNLSARIRGVRRHGQRALAFPTFYGLSKNSFISGRCYQVCRWRLGTVHLLRGCLVPQRKGGVTRSFCPQKNRFAPSSASRSPGVLSGGCKRSQRVFRSSSLFSWESRFLKEVIHAGRRVAEAFSLERNGSKSREVPSSPSPAPAQQKLWCPFHTSFRSAVSWSDMWEQSSLYLCFGYLVC